MPVAYVLGNGPSRLALDLALLRKDPTAVIFGCNAIHRDFKPDYIVAIDPDPIAELRNSDFPQHRILVPMRHEHWEPPELHRGVPNARRSNAGVNAVREAIRRDLSPIYLIGFDFLLKDPVKATDNVYDGTPTYEKERRANAADSLPRAAYLDHTIRTMGDGTSFVVVVPRNGTQTIRLSSPNVRYVTMDNLIKQLSS